MRRRAVAALALAGALMGMQPAAAGAQVVRSTTTGLHLGAALDGSAITADDSDDVESGAGLSLTLGYGLSNAATFFATATGANVNAADGGTYTLGHVDLGLRLSFADPARALTPYLEGAATGRAATVEVGGDDFDVTGLGFTAGGGVAWFLSPSLALDAGLAFTFGSFTEAEYRGETAEIDEGATSSRLDLGLSWWAG